MKNKFKTQSHSMSGGMYFNLRLITWCLIATLVTSCAPVSTSPDLGNMITPIPPTPVPAPTSGRPNYAPGELVDYIAQSGDTLPALAKRFNTTEEEIREANSIIPADATTMPPGFPM
ncbi:MAG TPA: LysM domain-containing protein, partial [Anaerolineales bacterium]|nr:LysM domain-containing protein [Anaerolineales bacterium]